MADPLSLLLGSKKKDDKPAPKAKASTGGLFGAPTPTSGSTNLFGKSPDLTDVSAALGRVDRLRPAAPAGTQAFTPSLPAASSESAGYPQAPPSSSPAAAAQASSPLASGLAAAASQLEGRPAPAPVQRRPGAEFDDQHEAEKVVYTVSKLFFKNSNPLCEVAGRLLVTNYRLKFQSVKGALREELRWMLDCKYFDVPMGTIEEAKCEQKTTVTGATELSLIVKCKDTRTLTFIFHHKEANGPKDVNEVLSAVQSFSAPGNTTLLFAFRHYQERMLTADMQEVDGWAIYDPAQEYARMGIETEMIPNPSCPWQVSPINSDYSLCSTYPAWIVLPRRMSDSEIRQVAAFRKKGRLPAMSWCGGPELRYASVWRCSQTTEGMKSLVGYTSPEGVCDEKMVQCIRQGAQSTSSEGRDLLLIDLRPWKSAWANKAGGGGFEKDHQRCHLIFGGIDNIHCVRDAWRAMGAAVNATVEGEVGSWIKDVANSSWYDYIGAILNCAMKVITELLDHKANVMVHCSDGWDRTAQATSLSMLCLDPHYRTQVGFLKLIAKEWCSFGHKFRTRMALGESPTSESSPVFIQWLEAVFQIVQQNPAAFEFTPAVLLRLSQEVTSNRFGTFFTDCEAERLAKVANQTTSLWSELLHPREIVTWRNPSYVCTRGAIVPSICQANYVVWEAYWWRFHPRSQRIKAAEAGAVAAAAAASVAASAAAAAAATAPSPASVSSAPAPPAAVLKEAADPAPDRLIEPLSPGPAEPAAAGAIAASPPSPVDFDNAGGSLFSAEELAETKRKPPPKQYFTEDDDDDVFSKPKSKKSEEEDLL